MSRVKTRAAIPTAIKRQVAVEAGHRCAIPTCRHYPIEYAHVVSWNEVKSHTFENIIALCPNCHTLFDKGQIDRKSMKIFKSNLGIINSRFMELEKHLLLGLKEKGALPIPGTMTWVFFGLAKDELITVVEKSGVEISGVESHYWVELTEPGKELVDKWLEGEPIK